MRVLDSGHRGRWMALSHMARQGRAGVRNVMLKLLLHSDPSVLKAASVLRKHPRVAALLLGVELGVTLGDS